MEPFLGGMSSRKGAAVRPTRRAYSTPTRSLAMSLLIGNLEMRRLLELRLEATGLDALDAVVIRMLLINEKASIGDIRETLALPPSTATHAIDRLCDRRYARREAGFDRRVVFVRLNGAAPTWPRWSTRPSSSSTERSTPPRRPVLRTSSGWSTPSSCWLRASDASGSGADDRLGPQAVSSASSSLRIAAPSTGSAWSQPQMWSVPWVTSRRSSSAGDQRTSPVQPPRPVRPGRSPAPPTPRCRRGGPGARRQRERGREVGRAAADAGPPACVGNASGARSGNDSTSVGPPGPCASR